MFINLILVALSAAAQDSRISIPLESEAKPVPWTAQLRAELRTQSDQRPRPQNRRQDSVHELSVAGTYRFDRTLKGVAELSLETLDGEEKLALFPNQAFVEWQPFGERAQLSAGQQFLPVGLLAPRDNLFSSNPPFLERLFGHAKPSDLGFTVRAQPFAAPWIYAEAGVYSGQLIRAQDQRRGDAQKSPRVVSLKSGSPYHDAFVSYFEHDLAFFDPVRAWGFGFELRTPEWRALKASLLSEAWFMEQVQTAGPDERTRAFLLLGEVEYRWLKAGYRWSLARSALAFASGSSALPNETSHLAYVEFKLAGILALRAERVREQQDLLLKDEWVGRMILDWVL